MCHGHDEEEAVPQPDVRRMPEEAVGYVHSPNGHDQFLVSDEYKYTYNTFGNKVVMHTIVHPILRSIFDLKPYLFFNPINHHIV